MQDFEHLSIRYRSGAGGLEVLDQRALPNAELWLPCRTAEDMFTYISALAVRGAPLIGCAAVLQVGVLAAGGRSAAEIRATCEYLITARPTAVNLAFCCRKVVAFLEAHPEDPATSVPALALRLLASEVDMNLRIADFGAALVGSGSRGSGDGDSVPVEGILTHCNTGALATPGVGTALGVIRLAHWKGKKIHVYVDETRPLLQGARLTAYELQREGIPYTLVCDNMAASLMQRGKVQRVFVGADRVAANGDFANKIGTYPLAICAAFHKVPFHVCAPSSTVDLACASGAQIPIEERAGAEVKGFGTVCWAPEQAPTWNPAFDVTPGALVTSFVFDTGVFTVAELPKAFANAATSKSSRSSRSSRSSSASAGTSASADSASRSTRGGAAPPSKKAK